jgi:hypothetical protein
MNTEIMVVEDRNRRADAKKLRHAKTYKYFVLLPDDTFRQIWDFIITIVLLITFGITPYKIAFIDNNEVTWIVIDGIIDFFFLVDIVLNFFHGVL